MGKVARNPYGPRKHPTRPWAKTIAALPTYAALFAERTPEGYPLSLREIGKRMGVTGEAVRQIRRRHFPDLPDMWDANRPITAQRKVQRNFGKQLGNWRARVRSWLRAEGYFQCERCRGVFCREMAAKGQTRKQVCKPCVAEKTNKYRAKPEGREKQRQWKLANPDKVEATWRRAYARKVARKAGLL